MCKISSVRCALICGKQVRYPDGAVPLRGATGVFAVICTKQKGTQARAKDELSCCCCSYIGRVYYLVHARRCFIVRALNERLKSKLGE
jgi:hypothetical protein